MRDFVSPRVVMNVLEDACLAEVLCDALRISTDLSTKMISVQRGQVLGDVERWEELLRMLLGFENQKEINGELGLVDEIVDGLDEGDRYFALAKRYVYG